MLKISEVQVFSKRFTDHAGSGLSLVALSSLSSSFSFNSSWPSSISLLISSFMSRKTQTLCQQVKIKTSSRSVNMAYNEYLDSYGNVGFAQKSYLVCPVE